MAVLIELKPYQVAEVLDKYVKALDEFADVMLPELPLTFQPRRAVDHRIYLKPGARPLEQALYRMAPSELAELRK